MAEVNTNLKLKRSANPVTQNKISKSGKPSNSYETIQEDLINLKCLFTNDREKFDTVLKDTSLYQLISILRNHLISENGVISNPFLEESDKIILRDRFIDEDNLIYKENHVQWGFTLD